MDRRKIKCRQSKRVSVRKLPFSVHWNHHQTPKIHEMTRRKKSRNLFPLFLYATKENEQNWFGKKVRIAEVVTPIRSEKWHACVEQTEYSKFGSIIPHTHTGNTYTRTKVRYTLLPISTQLLEKLQFLYFSIIIFDSNAVPLLRHNSIDAFTYYGATKLLNARIFQWNSCPLSWMFVGRTATFLQWPQQRTRIQRDRLHCSALMNSTPKCHRTQFTFQNQIMADSNFCGLERWSHLSIVIRKNQIAESS